VKKVVVAVILFALSISSWAQSNPSLPNANSAEKTDKDNQRKDVKEGDANPRDTPLHNGSNEYGLFVGGGNGFGKRSSTHMLYGGGRWGKVLTDDVLGGWLRGNFEFAIEAMPLYKVFQEGPDAFGIAITPTILKWNFLHHGKVKPFATLGGGLLITTHDVPQNTNPLNFTPQGGFGIHYLTSADHAITSEVKFMHVSNASLSNQNSGINGSIQFTIGYSWFK
jgi:lipid A 3-O-deacylase